MRTRNSYSGVKMSTHGVNQGNSMCGQAVMYDFTLF